jgi:hypothetical protein
MVEAQGSTTWSQLQGHRDMCLSAGTKTTLLCPRNEWTLEVRLMIGGDSLSTVQQHDETIGSEETRLLRGLTRA